MTDMANVPLSAEIAQAATLLDQNFDLLAGVSLRVSVEVGSATLTLRELLDLGEGQVIELDRQANDRLDIFANGTLIARGEVVEVDGRYGIRVAEIVNADRRLNDRGPEWRAR